MASAWSNHAGASGRAPFRKASGADKFVVAHVAGRESEGDVEGIFEDIVMTQAFSFTPTEGKPRGRPAQGQNWARHKF